jgi:excisionase family DNA binding protein
MLSKAAVSETFERRLLLRPAEAAEMLAVSRSRVYELISAGVIPHIRIGGSLRVPVAELDRWVAEQVAKAR